MHCGKFLSRCCKNTTERETATSDRVGVLELDQAEVVFWRTARGFVPSCDPDVRDEANLVVFHHVAQFLHRIVHREWRDPDRFLELFFDKVVDRTEVINEDLDLLVSDPSCELNLVVFRLEVLFDVHMSQPLLG